MNPMPQDQDPVPPISAADRMERMRSMFSEGMEILVEDYEHFTGFRVGAPTGRNRASRKSVTPSSRQGQGRS